MPCEAEGFGVWDMQDEDLGFSGLQVLGTRGGRLDGLGFNSLWPPQIIS